jgi:2-polyprenyl-6-methoxyphenol hydroxylase-like FAD-dependent oxidoreductase
MSQQNVLIVGAGPTGLTAALELARLGISVRIIDKLPQSPTTSRAIGIQARTLELFEQRGLLTTVLEKGNPARTVQIYGEGKSLFNLDFSNNGSRYDYLLFLSQYETEQVLQNALEAQQVHVERPIELIALSHSEHTDSVKAILKRSDGSLEEFHCSYLIDCEGAHSITRSTLNLQFEGKTRTEDYVLGDIKVQGNLSSSEAHIFSSPHGFMALFPMGIEHFRLIASHPINKPSRDISPVLQEIQTIYNQRSHIPAQFYDMQWSSYFKINSRMVEQLRIGRVFFGGDSAHIHSPAGAQGMNTGIQDMINLAWKLAFVIKGHAQAELLDTYNDDRLPVIRSVLSRTDKLTDLMGDESQSFRAIFSHIAPWIIGTEFAQETATRQMSQIALNYRQSPLSQDCDMRKGIKAGDRVPDMSLNSPTDGSASYRLHQLLSIDHFTLLLVNITPSEPLYSNIQAELATWKELVTITCITSHASDEQTYQNTFDDVAGLYLVRPDGYLSFSGSEDSLEELKSYLNTWLPIKQVAYKELSLI